MNKSQAIQKYIYLFENLHSALTPGALDRITAQNIHFIDPFHDITGRQKLYDLLQHTLNTVEMADFTVTHTAWDQDKPHLCPDPNSFLFLNTRINTEDHVGAIFL